MALTFLLSDSWDLQTDNSGNIATVSGSYAIAQNVANAVRLFTKDAYFNQDSGIPHFEIELGHKPPLSVLRSRINKAAKGVEGVIDAATSFDTFEDRILHGEIAIRTSEGDSFNVDI